MKKSVFIVIILGIVLVICCIVLFILSLLNNNLSKPDQSIFTYTDKVFAIVSNRNKKSMYEQSNFDNENEFLVEFPSENIVCEFSNVYDTGRIMTNDEYYCILYSNKNIEYVKGNMDAFTVINNDVKKRIEELYNSNIKNVPVIISAYNGYIKRTKKLSNFEYSNILKKLKTAENNCPYNDEFIVDTNHSFCGFYYNNKYFGTAPPQYIGKDIDYDEFKEGCYVFNDVINYIGEIIK